MFPNKFCMLKKRGLDYLISSEIIVVQNNKVGFVHQSILDYLISQNMIEKYFEKQNIKKYYRRKKINKILQEDIRCRCSYKIY